MDKANSKKDDFFVSKKIAGLLGSRFDIDYVTSQSGELDYVAPKGRDLHEKLNDLFEETVFPLDELSASRAQTFVRMTTNEAATTGNLDALHWCFSDKVKETLENLGVSESAHKLARPLVNACQKNHLSVVEFLLKSPLVNSLPSIYERVSFSSGLKDALSACLSGLLEKETIKDDDLQTTKFLLQDDELKNHPKLGFYKNLLPVALGKNKENLLSLLVEEKTAEKCGAITFFVDDSVFDEIEKKLTNKPEVFEEIFQKMFLPLGPSRAEDLLMHAFSAQNKPRTAHCLFNVLPPDSKRKMAPILNAFIKNNQDKPSHTPLLVSLERFLLKDRIGLDRIDVDNIKSSREKSTETPKNQKPKKVI